LPCPIDPLAADGAHAGGGGGSGGGSDTGGVSSGGFRVALVSGADAASNAAA